MPACRPFGFRLPLLSFVFKHTKADIIFWLLRTRIMCVCINIFIHRILVCMYICPRPFIIAQYNQNHFCACTSAHHFNIKGNTLLEYQAIIEIVFFIYILKMSLHNSIESWRYRQISHFAFSENDYLPIIMWYTSKYIEIPQIVKF